ncbi:MAG: helix-turn-helix domain-containing protein [Thermoanaerobaculia bacterium]
MATFAIDWHSMTTVEIDAYVLDSLMADLVGHDRQPSAFLVYLFLWRRTWGSGEATARVSLLDISMGTGLSKRAVQEALRLLAKRRLLSIQREGITAIPVYEVLRPWTRASPAG